MDQDINGAEESSLLVRCHCPSGLVYVYMCTWGEKWVLNREKCPPSFVECPDTLKLKR